MNETRNRNSVKVTAAGLEKLKKAKAAKRNYEEKKWTYLDIAREAGVGEKTVKRFFGGKENIDFDCAVAIAKALDIEIDELIDRPESKLPPPTPISSNWRNICDDFFQRHKKPTTSDYVSVDGAMRNLDDIYVSLGLVERKKRERREGNVGAEMGSQFYAPEEYELTQKYDETRFFNEVLQEGKTEKSQGKRLAIIGEPGAGKTTLLQKIGDWVFAKTDEVAIWVPLAAIGDKSLRDYLLEVWLRDAGGALLPPSPERQEDFGKWLTSSKVWLLLDGIDEMSSSTPLSQIASQLKEGWASRLRVVVSSRLNVWDADKNALFDFDTYRSLEFGYPEEVAKFIDNWFAGVPEKAERLKQQLDEPGKERIRDLIKNPLRLTLLCRTWQRREGLPDTQAQLYGRYLEDFYLWKEDEFSTTPQQRRELNQKLGELARRSIDRESFRFRLSHRLVCEVLGEGSEWFELAMRLGWLNKVGVAAENPDELVYAFFHPTFQEYFAALSVGDWRFFLPESLAEGSYRIFESQWKQVILLWLGRSDVEKWRKEEFIWALVDFKDECGGFYKNRALFLAAAGIAEFKDCSLGDAIVGQVIKLSFGYFDVEAGEWMTFIYPIEWAARKFLLETERTKTADALAMLICYSPDEDVRREAALSLGKIDPGNEKAIAALIELIRNSQSQYVRWQVAWSLGEIGQGNEKAIATLIEIIRNTQFEDVRRQATWSLGQIDPGNPEAIAALIELIRNTQFEDIRGQATWSLGQMDPGNREAIAALVELIGNSQSEYVCTRRALSLGKIDPGNETAINALVKLIRNSQHEDVIGEATKIMGEIGQGNPEAIAVLVELIRDNSDEDVRWQAASSLGKIDSGNETAVNTLVELIRNSQDENVRWWTAEILGEIGQGSPEAIAALVELIRSSQSEYLLSQAAESLAKIDPGNPEAIAALIELIGKSDSEYLIQEAAWSLGKIGQGNPEAIATLIEIISKTQHEYFIKEAAWSLGKIGQGNPEAIATLINLINNTQSEDARSQAISSLEKIATEPQQIAEVINTLKDYPNDCDYILWNYAQTLPYKKFHQAWHRDKTPIAQTLERQLANINTQLQHLPLWCVDADILANETTEEAIAQTLCELISTAIDPDADYPEVNNAPQLRRHLHILARQQKSLVILIHNCEPEEALQQFCRKLSNIARILWITDAPVEPPIKAFSPGQPNLVEAVESWLEEFMLGNGE